MPRLLAVGAAVAATSLAIAAAPSALASTPTPYGLTGESLGLRVVGGSMPANSGDLAKAVSACTTLAGVRSTNNAAAVALPGGSGRIGAMSSTTWTSRQSDGTVNRFSQAKVAGITIDNPATHTAALTISGLVSTSHVWHNASGYHYSTSMSAADVKLAGTPISLPTPKSPITIPGVATLAMGAMNRAKDTSHAFARIDGLLLTLQPGSANPTVLDLASTRAEIDAGATGGVFGGNATATKISALGGTLTSSGQPLVSMPCVGTKGKVVQKAIASAPLNSVSAPITLGAATSSDDGNQYMRNGQRYATGYERSSISDVNLGNGALVIKGLVARANVTRTGRTFNTVTANDNGTTAVSIVANGTAVPGLSQLNGKKISIPGGVATLQTSVVQKIMAGKTVIGERVTGLRITLLNASGQTTTVINLANADLRIKGH